MTYVSEPRQGRAAPLRSAVGGTRRVLGDPRTLGLAGALPRTAAFLWALQRRTPAAGSPDTPAGRPTLALAWQALLDEAVVAGARHPRLLPGGEDYADAAAELARARELYADRGWLAEPASYHRVPGPPGPVTVAADRMLRTPFERVAFPSGWEPYPGEPRRAAWLAHRSNRTVHAWVLRSGRDTGCWVVGVHGFGMGQPLLDLQGIRAGELAALGVNVALPVLPLHGPRADGTVRGEGLMSIHLLDGVHGLAQAVWDVRRLLRWLRAREGAQRVLLYGLSLGAQVAAVTAALQDGLDGVAVAVPVVDLPELFRHHSPPAVRRLAAHHGALGPAADDVHRVVSPLALPPPTVGRQARFVCAGLGDRMSPFDQSHRLWLHWERPARVCYPGGHLGFFLSRQVRGFLQTALRDCGLLGPAQRGEPAPPPPAAPPVR